MNQSFIFGGNTGLSYDQIQKQRDIANELLRANMSTPQNVGEGLSAIGRALAAKAIDKRTTRADEANRQASEARRASAMGAIFGGGMGGAAPFSPSSAPVTPAAPPSPGAAVADDTMSALGKTPMRPFRDAIASIESAGSGDYTAIGPTHPKMGRALGRYQVMEANIGPWSQKVLGRTVTPDEFLANPQLQDAIFDGIFGGYVQQFGPEGAAQAWFAGPGGVGKMDRQDVLGTSVADYTQKFTSALGGSAPAAPQPAPAGAMSMGNPAIVQEIATLLADPYTPEGDKAVLQQAMAMQLQNMDPMRQMEMERARLELEQLRNPQPGFTMLTDEEEAQMGLNPAGVYQRGADGSIKVVQDAPKADGPTSTMQEYEFARSQGYEGTFQQYQADLKKAGAANTTVTVGGDAAPPSDEPLRKKLMEGEGTTWGEYLKAGSTASGMRQDMELLNQVIELAPSGPITGRLAEMFPGVSDAAGVFQSVVKRVAPSLRVEGSGSQSDIEYNGFLQSLPALSNRPEANRAIAAFLQSKAQVNMDRAAAVSAYQNGEIDAVEARKRIAEIDSRSIMTPEIENLLGALDQGATAGAAGPAPEGVPQDVWDVMTDEERALFQ